MNGQTQIKIPDVPDSKPEFLFPVEGPPVHCMAVNDTEGILALGHKSGTTPHLTIYRLDGVGRFAGPPFTLTLPRPAALGTFANYPLSLAFHPKLPLLYVWQDHEKAKEPEAPEPPVFKEFNHLVIYRIDKAAPEFVGSFARGPEYFPGNPLGSVVFNAAGTRLYVPNLRKPDPKPSGYSSVGYFRLDAAGLPPAEDKGKPTKMTADLPVLSSYPTGIGFVPVSDEVIIVGGKIGPVTWDDSGPRPYFSLVGLLPAIGPYYHDYLAGHSTLPIVVATLMKTGYVARMEHADGYLTLAPQIGYLEGATGLESPPMFLERYQQVAFGSVNKVYLVNFDAKGRFTGKREQMTVANPAVEALAYSKNFDRLYVPVEKPK